MFLGKFDLYLSNDILYNNICFYIICKLFSSYNYYSKNFFFCQFFPNQRLDFTKIFWYNRYIKTGGLLTLIKLDYTLETIEERLDLVNKILEEDPEPNEGYLEVLGDYLTLLMAKLEKKEGNSRTLMTENRMVTINRRETSFEGLVSQFENGEDGIYNLITNDKYQIFRPKVTITKKDLEEIPELRQVRDAIKLWEEKLKTATGRDKYIIKKAIIDLRKDQYLIKDAYRCPVGIKGVTHCRNPIKLDGEIHLDENGYCVGEGVTLVDPKVISAILCNYSHLKQESKGVYDTYTWYLMEDFDATMERALQEYPLYQRIVEMKIDGKQNVDIQAVIEEEFGIKHSVEYISSLWRNKIPGIIASQAEDDYLDWYYLEVEKGKYKKCSRCGEIKLAHNKYFSKNKTSKDGFYSICKCCRNSKAKKS